MNRKEITQNLSRLTVEYIAPHGDPRLYWASEVTFDYGTAHQIRVDFMKFKPKNNTVSGIEKGDFYCFEIKSCIEDFNSKHGHNFIGDYNYYVMPEEVYERAKDKIPWNVGVLVPNGYLLTSLEVAKKPHRVDRKRSIQEILLMMFRSANRDRSVFL